jgi:hypothetical protein
VESITALVNGRGFSRHNAMVQIMMLQDWGLGKSWMSSIANNIANEEPQNPFFQYVAHRRESKASMLPLIVHNECPSEASDHPHLRSEWAWERDTRDQKWKDTMYWDCIFIAAAYEETGSTPPDDNSTENSLRQALNQAIKLANAAQQGANEALKKITDLLHDPVGTLGKEIGQQANQIKKDIQNPVAAVQQKANDVRHDVTHPGDALSHPGDTIRHFTSPF